MDRYSASSLDCWTPFDVNGGSVGMPVGDLTSSAVYCPVVGSTLQFDRNYGKASLSESMSL